MRILVTGVSGQLGAALVARLWCHDVIAADRATLDLSKLDQIADVLDRLGPQLIINPAAYTAVDKAEDEPDLARLVNTLAPAAIAHWASRRDVPLVHFSTDYVFDGSGERPWREEDLTTPLSVYGATKLDGENAVRAEGGSFLIVRTSWIYSAFGSNFLRTIAGLSRERKELRVVADQVGAPTSADLIAEIVTGMLLEGPAAFREHCAQAKGLVHVSAAGETSWHGFATAIIDGLKAREVRLAVEEIRPIRSEDYFTRAKRPRNSRFDLGRLRGLFGVNPPPWADVLTAELDHLARTI